jgi:hypothetical protein
MLRRKERKIFKALLAWCSALMGVLAPNLKIAIDERNRSGHGRRLCCRDFSPSCRGDILRLVTGGLPHRILLRLGDGYINSRTFVPGSP